MTKLSFKLILTALIVVLAFTAIDYAGHKYLEAHNGLEQVPSTYFGNKIIFGSLLLLAGVFVVDWLSRKYPKLQGGYYRASALTLWTILLLQLRYIYVGYSLSFHLQVLLLHYFALSIPLYMAQKWRFI